MLPLCPRRKLGLDDSIGVFSSLGDAVSALQARGEP